VLKLSCPFCQRESSLHFRTKDRNRLISEEVFHYYRCPGCGLIFLSPMPEDLGRYYPPDYHAESVTLEQIEAAATHEQYKIELVQRFVKGGRLLEIGPSVGGFCYVAKRAGFEVEAIEMDEQCCRFLEESVGIRAIHSSDTKGALLESGPYDVIALWHVIEHLPDPFETFEVAAARLKPGGILVIAAPNPASFQFRFLRRYWTHVDAPRHVFLIPSERLVERGHELELEPVLVTTTDEGGVGWNKFGWEQSLFNLTRSSGPRHFLRRVGTRLTALAGPFERRDLSGSAYTIVLRKGGTA
jgi:2-polyprenyl-3-methyl-5-hydroxy-6-metoxy-1,4-benzoquinol methylase